jgi:quinol-cytochrome oxidoreductase complex cytochrome b subunit
MFGVIGKIFGSGDVIKSGIDLIDSLHTSTEEEIAAKSKAKVDMLNAYAPFKLAQRVIAFSFTFVYLVCFSMVLGFTLMDNVADADKIKQVLEDFQIGYAMLVILAFYFGAGAAEGVMSARGKK